MKRPVPIYFVAAWCLLGLALATSEITNWLKPYIPEGEPPDRHLKLIRGMLGILALWHVWLLAKLRPFNRWLSVAFFGWWTVALIWNGATTFSNLENSRGMFVFIVPGVLNGACIWYLVNRSFREFAVRFVAENEQERNSRAMQKAAAKRTEHEVRNIRS